MVKNDAEIKRLLSNLTQLEERLELSIDTNAETLDQLRHHTASKVHENALEEVHDRIDELISYLEERHKSQDVLSHITETVAQTSRASSGK